MYLNCCSHLFVVVTAVIVLSAQLSQEHAGHGHAHDDGHGHSHDHGGHGHSHEHGGHGHSHEHGGHGHSHGGHGHSHGHDELPPSHKYSRAANTPPDMPIVPPIARSKNDGIGLWAKALLSTLAISCAPVLILLVIRIDNSDAHQSTLNVLLAFAAGALLGDAFLHLIPHAVMEIGAKESPGNGHAHSHNPQASDLHHGHSHGGHSDAAHFEHIMLGAWILGGITFFLSVEVITRWIRTTYGSEHGHSHSHKKDDGEHKSDENADKDKKSSAAAKSRKRTDNSGSSGSEVEPSNADQDKVEQPSSQPNNLRVAAYLNLVADFTHNFTDGMAIGAAYLVGGGVGILTTATVFFHEIPHEIGDYAILIKSGSSHYQAIGWQLVTALGAMLGTVVTLTLGTTSTSASSPILPFTAGGFIYIAMVSVLPDLLESKAPPKQVVAHLVAFVIGLGMMALIAQME